MKLFRISLLLGASIFMLGAVIACSSDDDEESGTDTPAATSPPGGGSGTPKTVTVEAKEFSYEPKTFTVTAGEDVTVTMNNTGNAPHTLTVYTDEDYKDPVDGADTGTINGDDSGEFTATFEGGEYYFRCEVHQAQMKGTFEAE